tara:strand:+ start:2829 stop:4004 length:1176 start_codon:yes stop_codon:yes gene_type:complete
MENSFDIIIVGGGIVGVSIMYSLLEKKPKSRVLLIEKENSLAFHQTGHNSGVIHSGIYYEPNSLKAINCLNGYKDLIQLCNKNNIEYRLPGKLIAARNEFEENQLLFLKSRGEENGLENLQILNKSQIKDKEPYLNAKSALHVPQTGIIDYKKLTEYLAQKIIQKGGNIFLNKKVTNIIENVVYCGKDKYKGDKIIIASGVHSDKFSVKKNKYKILPFRGEYFKVSGKSKKLVQNIVYPVPDLNFPFLGVHFTNSINDTLEIGPNALLSFSKENYNHKLSFNFKDTIDILSFKGLYPMVLNNLGFVKNEIKKSFFKKEFMKEIHSYYPFINEDDISFSRSGIRAQICKKNGELVDDFIIENNQYIINILNAPSPAATSALSISNQILNKYL